MSKASVTKKFINETYGTGYVFQISYCGANAILTGLEPFGYHAGIYGWNCDMYELKTSTGIRICVETGYRPSGIKVPSELLNTYNAKAGEAYEMSNMNEALTAVRTKFADELVKL